jgi:hypothetical protein
MKPVRIGIFAIIAFAVLAMERLSRGRGEYWKRLPEFCC